MNIVSIGGSDPSSGAGIQSDIKTFENLDKYGFSVITAITSQNTQKFSKVEPISSKTIRNQLESIFSDFKIDAVKIGMVYDKPAIHTIYSFFRSKNIPIVLDPVIISSTGGILLRKSAVKEYMRYLIPMSAIITPNVFEAEQLTGIKIKNKKDLTRSGLELETVGAKGIVITGFQPNKKEILDYVRDGKKEYFFVGKKLQSANHGSGCNFSAALTVAMATGKNLGNASKFAKNYTYESIKNSKKIGKGLAITYTKSTKEEKTLQRAINQFSRFKKIHLLIPECQTNFVFSKDKARTLQDILGVRGRIVKAGDEIIMAGDLQYGGSKHVATAVMEMKKKFPEVRSAINLRYDEKFLQKLSKSHLRVLTYDRTEEPVKMKERENSTIRWGVRKAIKGQISTPDVIYHKGDFGKEPMILIFGKNPEDILDKIKDSLDR